MTARLSRATHVVLDTDATSWGLELVAGDGIFEDVPGLDHRRVHLT